MLDLISTINQANCKIQLKQYKIILWYFKNLGSKQTNMNKSKTVLIIVLN
jgi:hypothetical protein